MLAPKTYVVDTNILVDYVDLIPSLDADWCEPKNPSIDMRGSRLVIPTVVVRELSHFQDEETYRVVAARTILKRLLNLFKGIAVTMEDVYLLKESATVRHDGRSFTLLPVHINFKRALPFCPSEDDMDAQIILAALTVAFVDGGLPIDGTAPSEAVMRLNSSHVTILTNDHGMASRAIARGLTVDSYRYDYPPPYTGRRDLVVPAELFREFYKERLLERGLWEAYMPDEPPLVANEFIVMHVANPREYPDGFDGGDNPYFRHIARYDVEWDALVPLEYVSEFPVKVLNDGQAIYAEALMNPNFAAVICTGPAGSGKTYMPTIYGYDAYRRGKYIGITVVPCKNHNGVGSLPGGLNEKMDPDTRPIKNALRNYLLKEDAKFRRELERVQRFGVQMSDSESDDPEERSLGQKLDSRINAIWSQCFINIPVDSASGRDFAHELAIYDEFQDQNASRADTLIKRLGEGGKIILAGDVGQIHATYLDEYNNGLVYASRWLRDSPMVAQTCFLEEEIIRHPLIKVMTQRQKAAKAKKPF